MSKTEKEALDAIKFCLMTGAQPFRTDIYILVKLIERIQALRGG